MSTTLHPREVDKPYLRRWSLAALALLVRAPLGFGLVIATLGALDTYAANLAHDYVMPRWAAKVLCVLIAGLLPIVWVVVASLARSADRSLGAGAVLEPIARRGLWQGVLFAVLVQIGQDLVGFVLFGIPTSMVMVMGQGWLVTTVATHAGLLTCIFGSCYFPLLVQAPGASAHELWKLSSSADRLNGHTFVRRERQHVLSIPFLFVGCMMVLSVALSSVVPAFGMTNAAFLVFLGVFNYVGYRDIFERRAENSPLVSAPVAALPAANTLTDRPAINLPVIHSSRGP